MNNKNKLKNKDNNSQNKNKMIKLSNELNCRKYNF